MALDLAYSYAGIIKSEKQEDGTLKVYGKATDDAIDIDQQICDETWLKEAMPDWFTSGGNIREQHSNIAAGVATDYEAKADGHYITALIVDPVSVKKVETGVLKGFSIGIRGPRVIRDQKAAGGRIVGGQIVEVSVVDRPANPNAKMVIAKAVEGGVLEAVSQITIPTPSEAFKSVEAAIVEESAEGETVSEEITTEVEAPVEEVVAEVAAEEVATEEKAEEVVTPEAEIINAAKSLLGTLNKFDQATFDRARVALADLIVVEANEMATTGISEKDSIEELLDSVKHLFRWYEGEVAEGEVAGVGIVNAEAGGMVELSTDADTIKDVVICENCGEDEKMCKCDSMKSVDAEAAEEAAPAESNLEANGDEIAAIVEKAVTTAREAVSTEIAALKSAQEAALSKAAELEAELTTALSKAATGGPKRASLTKTTNTLAESELIQKSAEYLQKAALTADKTLAEGYRELAEDFKLKAAKAARKEAN